MTDHAEREKMSEAEARLKAVRDDIRQSLESYYWPSDTNAGDKDAEAKFASARRSAAIDMKAYEFAVLASARERVEALRQAELPDTVEHIDDEGDSIGFGCTVCGEREHDCRCEDKRDAHNAALDAAARAITEAT